MTTKLTTCFNLEEFAVSAQHPALARDIAFSDFEKYKAFYLSRLFLQPVRDYFQQPVIILSGKRTQELNGLVGGSPLSDHLYLNETAAVDFTVQNVHMETVYNWLKGNRTGAYGQLILYTTSNFIHVSLPSQMHINEAWTWAK